MYELDSILLCYIQVKLFGREVETIEVDFRRNCGNFPYRGRNSLLIVTISLNPLRITLKCDFQPPWEGGFLLAPEVAVVKGKSHWKQE